MMLSWLRILWSLSVLVNVAVAEEHGVGVRLLELDDPVSQRPMKAAVFYPSSDRSESMRLGPLEIGAKKDAKVSSGRHPVVLFSHGNGGSMFSHHDTAEYLARHGYIVAAIEHPGDNFRDESGQGSDRVMVGRNLQLSELLNSLLRTGSAVSEFVDTGKIGVAGFSAGGYTALLMVGAQPRFELLAPYCRQYPKSVLCAGEGSVRLSSPPLAVQADSRIRAAFVMSPVAVFFDRQSLGEISVPVYLYAAEGDTVLPPDMHARRIRAEVRTLTGYTEVPGADHFVFLSPCSPQMERATPALCKDKPDIDRRRIHEALNRDMLRFFEGQLRSRR